VVSTQADKLLCDQVAVELFKEAGQAHLPYHELLKLNS
jgi:hypothetical protein